MEELFVGDNKIDKDVFNKYANSKVPRYTSYPTSPHFSDAIGKDDYKNWLSSMSDLGRPANLSLYLHVPYCESMCNYCGCHTKITKKYNPIEKYATSLMKEIELLSKNISSANVSHIHFGGGTPTMLSSADFTAIMNKVTSNYAINNDAEIAIEIDPRTVDSEKIKNLASNGINRASFGAQDFNEHVQVAIGRMQSFELTKNVVDQMRDEGIENVNFDLMYGLPKQTTDDILRTVEMTAKVMPERVALFGYAHVPWFKKHQRLIKEVDLPDANLRFEQSQRAAKMLVDIGYVQIGLDHFALPQDSMAIALSNRTLRRNFQGYTVDTADALLGLGASSIGKLPSGYVKNRNDILGYNDKTLHGDFVIEKGLKFTDDDKIRSDVIEQIMCYGDVDLNKICSQHGVGVDYFDGDLEKINVLVQDGLIEFKDNTINIPSRLQVFYRVVASVFDAYLPQVQKRHSVAV